jgi:hypothetical protein
MSPFHHSIAKHAQKSEASGIHRMVPLALAKLHRTAKNKKQ